MEKLDFYIDGSWVTPSGVKTLDVINPASEEKVTKISLGDASHVNEAVKAARKAFETSQMRPRRLQNRSQIASKWLPEASRSRPGSGTET